MKADDIIEIADRLIRLSDLGKRGAEGLNCTEVYGANTHGLHQRRGKAGADPLRGRFTSFSTEIV